MLWKSSVNTYQIPDEVHDWFTRGQGNWDVPIRQLPFLRAFVLMLNSCCTAPFSACSGVMNEFMLYTSSVVYMHKVTPFHSRPVTFTHTVRKDPFGL